MVILLLLANIAAYWLFNMHMGDQAHLNEFLWNYGVIPFELVHRTDLAPSALGYQQTVATSMFLHANMGHIAMNMFVLLLVGPAIEKRFGAMRFVILAGLAGIGAALAHCYAFPDIKVPLVGASGWVSGLLGAWFVTGANGRTRFFLVAWFASQFFVNPASTEAWVAHVGGFIVGMGVGAVLDPGERRYRTATA